ncbi:MAG: amidase [Proteobacteria bacterium SG_bin9]|nr:MAG: amidase [Proteobacteria bacterium SG_bin9]
MTASSRDRLEETLARIADPKGEGARACLTVYADAARKEADAADARAKAGQSLGPMDGVVITIKDLFDVAGEVTRAGSKVLAARGKPATADAPTIAALRKAGAVIAAKTNMVEFAFSGVGVNPHYGTPGNPADRKRVPGGSTSGGAVAVADGMGAITIGTDTGGSTRTPASLCGIVGFKPTQKRITRAGAYPLSFSLDSIGPMAKTVAECALADAVLAGEATEFSPLPLNGVRAGLVQGMPLDGLDDTVSATFGKALAKLSGAWRSASDVTLDALPILARVNERGGLAPPEAYAVHQKVLAEDGDRIDPSVRQRIMRAANMTMPDYVWLQEDRKRAIAQTDALFDRFDVLVLPTTPIVAPLQSEVASLDVFVPRNVLLLRNTSIGNFFDLCAISLPINLGNALPCGLMLFGRHGSDRKLLSIAASVEKALAA